MDPTYDNMVGIDHSRHNSSLSMARSMRVVKQERSMEREEKPRKQRKRALVACDRCRKRKIKCNGDLDSGKACSSCLSVGATECAYNRVNSWSVEKTQREAAKMAVRHFAANPQARSNFLSSVPHRDDYHLDVQPSFRQSVAMDSLYDEQSANYGQTSSGYMLPNSNAMLDYSTAWSNRGWDLSRPGQGEYFDEQNQAGYGFILPGQSMSDIPHSTGPGANYTEAVDRTLPTPQSRPQQTPPTLLTLPDNLSGMTLAPDSKPPFWNMRYSTSPDTRAMPMPPNNTMYPQTQARMKQPEPEDTTPDLIFDMPPSTAANPPYPSLDTIESPLGVGGYAHDARGFPPEGQRLPLTPDGAADVYGYASSRKRGEAETRCSASTLVSGMTYTRVRHGDSGSGPSFNYLLDALPQYGRMEGAHRSPVPPLGGHEAY
ncbi:uncharacterized protein N7515_009102 [Penicillium bovifimosum]|uniref:Zn(2)-C6 fungal-type domain-containing protein n=1 Tax=Penicillium bovifimosum TaxID=126998 RepID=A0A9W9GJ02_9EURO|nr:uncharacterized protein N7515_009102 [Penicillium bovifimosum]KAJ5121141.1 hypothetical protein N7515_009102 [Penicillium bovifimosum]